MATSLNDDLASKIEEMSDQVEAQEKEKKKNNNNKGWKIAAIVVGVLLLIAAAAYAVFAHGYSGRFLKSTFINGIDCSDKTPEEARELINEGCRSYAVTVVARFRDDELITADEVGLHMIASDDLDRILDSQNRWMWLMENKKVKDYDITTITELDDDKLINICKSLPVFDDSTVTESVNAKLGDYDPSTGSFSVVPEVNGNKITDKDAAIAHIKDCILKLKDTADLNDADVYPVAEITKDNAGLLQKKKELDRFVGTKITYTGSDIVLDGNTIKDWIVTDDLGVVGIDENKIAAFVDELAEAYDTLGEERTFKTQYGNEVQISGGTFGWKVDKDAEIAQLKVQVPESAIEEREPNFSSRGSGFGDNEIGNTYVEVNLAKQHLFLIKNGKCILESDLVSGGLQRKAATPTGYYFIFYKASPAVLRGPRRADGSYDYVSHVTYWMPFNKGIGLHDATWRSSFGGNIYKYNGSHGCINLPYKKAKAIYAEVEKGTPVIVYNEDFTPLHDPVIEGEEAETKKATETKKETTKKQTTTTQSQTQAETAPIETAAPETAVQESTTAAPSEPCETEPQSKQQETEYGPAFETLPAASVDVTTGVANVPGE